MSKTSLISEFQDEVKEFSLKLAKEKGLDLVMSDNLCLFKFSEGEYAATSGKSVTMKEFWDDASTAENVAMFDLASTAYKQYRGMAIKIIAAILAHEQKHFTEAEITAIMKIFEETVDKMQNEKQLSEVFNGIEIDGDDGAAMKKRMLEAVKILK